MELKMSNLKFIANAFSLKMLGEGFDGKISIRPASFDEAKEAAAAGSEIGHKDIADLLSAMFECEVPVNRVDSNLSNGDAFVVAQYFGPRLKEGQIDLPEGARIEFIHVSVE